MSKTFTTPKGTQIPLISLKGKDYMQVAWRLVWFTEEVPRYHISTVFLSLDQEQAVAQTTILILDEQGNAIKKAVGTKRETLKDFPDFIEKAETGSSGRALAQLGFGTQFAQADLDEGTRLADAPLEASTVKPSTTVSKPTSFRKTTTNTVTAPVTTTVSKPVESNGNGTTVKSNDDGEWL